MNKTDHVEIVGMDRTNCVKTATNDPDYGTLFWGVAMT